VPFAVVTPPDRVVDAEMVLVIPNEVIDEMMLVINVIWLPHVDVAGGSPATHYVSALTNVSGVLVPTTIFPRQPDGTSAPAPLVVSIDISDIEFQLGLLARLETAPSEQQLENLS